MLRQAARPVLRASSRPLSRSFSVAAARMAEGDTGAPRSTGSAETAGDPWQKKESAQENLYMRQREAEKLRAIKEKLKKQREHLDELDAHLDSLTKEQGGEQH